MNWNGGLFRKVIVILAVFAMVPVAGHAFGPHGGTGKRMGPPQEAINACADLNEGDMVQFTTRRGKTVSGICRDVRGGLIAVPEGKFNGRHRGGGPGNRVARMSKALDLTEAQQEEVKAILESAREKTVPLRQQLAETRKQIREAIEAEPFDESAVRALMEDQGQTRIELAVSRARTRNQIFALLTPEQRETAKTVRPWGKRRHGHRHW